MQDSFQNNERFIGEIENLYKLHHITKKYNHIIKYEPGWWKLFEPSKFIYAFFAFNSFYNFDWEQSLKNKQLCLFEMKSVDGGEQAVTESFKYKAMVNFIFKHITESDHQLFLKLIKGNEKIDSMLNAISSITPDARIEWKDFGSVLFFTAETAK